LNDIAIEVIDHLPIVGLIAVLSLGIFRSIAARFSPRLLIRARDAVGGFFVPEAQGVPDHRDAIHKTYGRVCSVTPARNTRTFGLAGNHTSGVLADRLCGIRSQTI